MTYREEVIDLIEEMTDEDLRALAAYARGLRGRDGADPVALLLDQAPIDDQPTTEEEDRQAEEGWQAHLQGETVSLEDVRRRLRE